jgi:hypothetical protein
MAGQAGTGEGEPESGDREDGQAASWRPDARDGAGAGREGIVSGWGHRVGHWD